MNVLYCGDKNIADGLMISALSLLNNVCEPINVYILTVGFESKGRVCEPLPSKLADFLDAKFKETNPENSVTLVDATEVFKTELPFANLETRFTPCCMLRLFADIIPDIPDKILYLDTDVVCRKDCSEFYSQDMQGFEVAGVLDRYGKWFFRSNIFKMDYLNSGVLLLNLRLIRESGMFRECRKRCADKKMFMPDQSAINKLSKAKKILPRCYNEQRISKNDTVFQHFTTSFRFFPYIRTVSVKPWHVDRLHSELGIYEYDGLLAEFGEMKSEYEKMNGEKIYEK